MSDPAVQSVNANPPTPRRVLGASIHFWFAVLGVSLAMIGAVLYFTYLDTNCNGLRQARIMRSVGRDIDRIMPSITANPAFQNVDPRPFTAGTCGCMSVRGAVLNEASALQLRDALAAFQLPYEVKFYLDYTDGSYFVPANVPEIPAHKPTPR
jgi:hypothetical protein